MGHPGPGAYAAWLSSVALPGLADAQVVRETTMRLVLLALVCLCGLVASASTGAPAGQPPPGWDEYQAIMWSTGAARDLPAWFARLKEIGCTAEEAGRGSDPGPFLQNRFGFYV